MVICVKCCDSITRAKAKENGWIRVDGAWHCPKDLAGIEISEKKKRTDNSKKERKKRIKEKERKE